MVQGSTGSNVLLGDYIYLHVVKLFRASLNRACWACNPDLEETYQKVKFLIFSKTTLGRNHSWDGLN